MSLNRDTIGALIPHAGRMRLLEQITTWDGDTLRARSRSHADPANPLATNEGLHAVHLVEYAAQAAAVHGALLAGGDAAGPSARGVLAGLRSVSLSLPRVERRVGVLEIYVRRLLNQPGGCLYEARVTADGERVLGGRLAIRFPD